MATVRIQLRRGTSSQWDNANPTLAAGEIGIETDTNTFKFGDGVTAWNDLDYALSDTVDDYIPLSLKGAANGVAELDGSGKVPYSQIPSIDELSQDAVNTALVAGTGITKTYNDGANTITVAVDTSVIATKAELAEVSQDSINDALVAGEGLNKTYDDVNNLITIDIDSTVATLTGTQTLTNKTLTSPVINTPTGIVKADVGLSNVDNTSDVNKPVSTAQAAADTAVANNAANALSAHESSTTNVHGIADTAALVTTSGSQTLTSKTLTSPALTGTPTAPTATAGTDTTQIATTAFVQDAIELVVNAAPEALNTLSEIATSLNNDADLAGTLTTSISTKVAKSGDTMTGHLVLSADPTQNLHPATKQYVDGAINTGAAYVDTSIEAHRTDTTNVHGIADTANLITTTILSTQLQNYATTSSLTSAINTVDTDLDSHTSSTTGVHGIADTSVLVTTDDLSDHTSLTTGVHGITDTSVLVTTTDLSGHTSLTTGVHGIADTSVLVTTTDLSGHTSLTTNVHGIADTADLVTKNGSEELTNKTITSPKINENVGLTATSTELNVLDGITASTAELNYINGVTSSIQTQLDAKLASATAASTYAPIASPTFTGTVSGVSKSMVGLGNVDNTSDADKPVSTATQTALDAKLSLSGGTMTGALTLSGAPSSDLHAATKAYVDNVSSGINFHQPVRVATTGNITLSGTQTIDGVAVVAGDRVLVKDQTNQTQNGIYVVASGSWTRATDADNTPSGELAGGDFSLVLEGTVNSGYGYVCSNTSAITIGTTNVTYAAFNAAKAVTAGSGLTESTPGTLDIATGGVTSAMIADGTIVDADINASAAIAQSKISNLTTDLAAKAPLASPTFTGTVTLSASGVSFTDGTQTKAGVPSLTTIGTTIGAAYNLSTGGLALRDQLIPISGTYAVTVPANSTTAYPVGTSISFYQSAGTGANFVEAAGVTILRTPGLKLRTTASSATLTKVATDTWLLAGDLSA